MMQTTPSFEIRQGSWNDLGRMAGALRTAVFVREQGVPPELEMDVLDPLCLHVLALAADGQAVATGRLVLHALLNAAQQRGDHEAVLSAQLHAQGFYTQAGFVAEGDVYDDAGIPHITMRKKLHA